MDYLKTSATFKVRKVLRYLRLYGPQRTLAKVRGQIHMQRVFETLPSPNRQARPSQTIGLIGCGNYAYTTIAYYLSRSAGPVIRGVMDIDINKAASLYQRYKAAYYTDDPNAVVNDDAVDLVYIASNHASHAEYAIAALDRGKSVYIEKPHVVSEDQLTRLVDAAKRSDGRVFLGFNRPVSRFGTTIADYLGRETGPAMYNWFVAGHVIGPDHWYLKPEEGGRVLGNLCHWTDFILGLTRQDMYPIEVNPTRAAGSNCDIAVSYKFADGTVAGIMFSAKEHTFEGIKERFAAHKGNCLITMDDFQAMKIEVGESVRRYKSLFRDQGHASNIISSYRNVKGSLPYDRQARTEHIWNTGMLFLKTKQALDSDARVLIQPYSRGV